MTVTSPKLTDAAGQPDAVSTTPTVRAAGRKALFWVVAGVGAVLVAIAATLIAGGTSAAGPPLAADNPAPIGGMALVEVLRQQGVTVTIADSLDEARSAASAADNPTVFFYGADGYLDDDQLHDLAGIAPRLVVADPDFAQLQAFAPLVGSGGVSSAKELTAQCDVPAAVRAESVSTGGATLGIGVGDDVDGQGDEVQGNDVDLIGCFPTEGNSGTTYAMVTQVTAGEQVTLVADTAVFSNETITDNGNAALALGLLGESDSLVWYLPTLADVAQTGPPSLGALTPGWVTPALGLLVLSVVAAAVWRGRRFGPLVAENLPVTVKASETMEGRARLYARTSSRLRTIDALRIGTLQRMAAQAGLSRSASLDEVVGAVAAITGRPVPEVRQVLVDDIPQDDRALLALSDRLTELERHLITASTGNAHGRMDT